LQPLLNGFDESRMVGGAAVGTLLRKFRGGPGVYEGLFELIARTYRALADGGALPVSAQQILEVNRLIDALRPGSNQS
jgi:hypothetical protein